MSAPLENCSTPEQYRQSILSNLQVNGNVDIGDITQLIVQIKQGHYLKPTGIPYNVPDSGTIEFVGREKDLKDLCEKLQQNKEVAVLAIKGMGGVGKTELAKMYARLFWEIYLGGICWLEARDKDIGLQIVRFAVVLQKLLENRAILTISSR
jgi:hypothetical protein